MEVVNAQSIIINQDLNASLVMYQTVTIVISLMFAKTVIWDIKRKTIAVFVHNRSKKLLFKIKNIVYVPTQLICITLNVSLVKLHIVFHAQNLLSVIVVSIIFLSFKSAISKNVFLVISLTALLVAVLTFVNNVK